MYFVFHFILITSDINRDEKQDYERFYTFKKQFKLYLSKLDIKKYDCLNNTYFKIYDYRKDSQIHHIPDLYKPVLYGQHHKVNITLQCINNHERVEAGGPF